MARLKKKFKTWPEVSASLYNEADADRMVNTLMAANPGVSRFHKGMNIVQPRVESAMPRQQAQRLAQRQRERSRGRVRRGPREIRGVRQPSPVERFYADKYGKVNRPAPPVQPAQTLRQQSDAWLAPGGASTQGEEFGGGFYSNIGPAIGKFFTSTPDEGEVGVTQRFEAASSRMNRGQALQEQSDAWRGEGGRVQPPEIDSSIPTRSTEPRDQGQYVAMRARGVGIPKLDEGLYDMRTAAGGYLELNPDILEALQTDNIENLDPGLVRALEILGMYTYGQAIPEQETGGLYGGGYGYGGRGYSPRRSIASYSPGGSYAYMGLTNWRI